jgi:leader peptidase (prepilin peptidase) / N-methyltransferase
MDIIFYPAIFIFGLIIGSFLNCVIYRLERGKSFLKGRSYCPECKHVLSPWDLVPLLSFIFLRGRCRYCKKAISWQYPLVEILTALIFLLIFNFSIPAPELAPLAHYGVALSLVFNLLPTGYLLLVSSLLIVIFVFDLKHYIIPDGAIYAAIGAAFLYNFLDLKNLPSFLISGAAASAFFLAIFLISRGKWMGFGDVKLAAFMGLFLGWPNIAAALFLGFFIGAIIGVGLMILKKKKMSSEIPFGPFLITGTFLALFFGTKLIGWYLNFLI